MRIAVSRLYEFCLIAAENYDNYVAFRPGADHLSAAEWADLKSRDLVVIVAAAGLDGRLGGDAVINYVGLALEAVVDGYTVYTWYGPAAEVLVVGYREHELELWNDGPGPPPGR